MATVVVPFRGSDPKRRLPPVAEHDRVRLAEAMLADVLAAASGIGRLFVVAPGTPTLPDGVQHVPDPRRGQGAAVRDALDAAVSAGAPAPYLVVNADLPCATPRDLLALAGALPDGGLAVAAAADGTTNALALSHDELFEPLYGPGQRRALRGARAGGARRRSEPRRRRRHPRRPDAHRSASRPAHACPVRRVASGTRRVKVAVLSGGIGGARFLRGLIGVVDPSDVSIVGNVGDDTEVLGLHVSPDLDSVLYTLTGLADEERGWGRADETWHALDTVTRLGGESWFKLGDRDIGLHLVRTQLLREGVPLSEATERIAHALGLEVALLPATNDPLRTFLETPAGTFAFQTWFVARGHKDEVDAVHYAGAPEARAAPGVLDALRAADVILIAPSNPYVSIGPILAVDEIRSVLEQRTAPCVAVSPLVDGRAVKGPADRMLRRLAGGTTPEHVARCYEGLIDVLVVDESDAPSAPVPGLRSTVVTQTLMTDVSAARRLAAAAVHAAGTPA